MLRIYLAGRFQASDGRSLVEESDLPGPQGRLVAAYLILERSRFVGRDELANAIWADELPTSWEVSTRALVSKVRSALRPVSDPATGTDGSRKRQRTADSGGYRLGLPGAIEVDVERAASATHAAESALRGGDQTTAGSEALVASLIAARGFLPGVTGAWADEQRVRLVDLRVRALDCLGEVWLQTGDAAEAARDAERVLALDPYHEGAVRRLMRACVAAGQRSRALRVYEEVRARFIAELGIEPDPSTRQLRDRIAAGG